MSRRIAVALTLAAIVGVASVRSQEGVKPGGALAHVPADAVGFVHIKVGDIWKAEMLGPVRELFAKAGPKALAAFDERFVPPPSSVESMGVFFTPGDDDNPPTPGIIVAFNKTFEPAKAIKALLPNGKAMTHFGQKYTADVGLDLAVKVLDNQSFLLSQAHAMPNLIGRETRASALLTPHLRAAAGKPLYATLNVAALPKSWMESLPEALQPLASAKEIVAQGVIGKQLTVEFKAKYADAAAAAKAEVAAREGLKVARQSIADQLADLEKLVTTPREKGPAPLGELPTAAGQLFVLAVMRSVDEQFAKPPLKVVGDTLVMEQSIDPSSPTSVLLATGMASILGTRSSTSIVAGTVTKSQNNLKQLALGMHNHEAALGTMPHALYSRDGKKALLSWRVAILPYIEQVDLYKQFKLNEPWDSENNKKLIARMPEVFIDPDAPPAREVGTTHYQVLITGGAGFRKDKTGMKFSEITDGSSNTIMIAVATDPVIWTQPDDLVYDPLKPLPPMGFGKKSKQVAFFDGSVRGLNPIITERTLRALITRAGGELIGDDF